MTKAELKTQIELRLGEEVDEEVLSVYMSQAQRSCANWEYQLTGIPEDIDYDRYDFIVGEAVLQGLTMRGAEGETQHTEGGINRSFRYADMDSYIRSKIIPCVCAK